MQSSNGKAFQLLCFLFILSAKHVCWIEVQGNSDLDSITTLSRSVVDPLLSFTTNLPVDKPFQFPSPLPQIPSAVTNFGKGKIDLGGLEVVQVSISTSNSERVWITYEGGADNKGVSIYKPTNLPPRFFKLGFCAQPNNRVLFGWVLVARDVSGNSLRPPLGYILAGNTTSLSSKQDRPAYFWQPQCSIGYQAVGLYVTTSPLNPSLGQDSISCVLSALTEQIEADTWVWSLQEMTLSSLRPVSRGSEATGVYTGTFNFHQLNFPTPPLLCLKNTKFDLSSMPNRDQTKVLFGAYSPWVYMHPDEEFLPSSVNWAFSNGALLYQKGNESNPVPIQPDGSNLPQGGSDEGLFWIDYPADKKTSDKIKRGDLGNTKVYLHVKPMFGGTFTDIVVWIFYPFNGNARVKFLFVKSQSLGDLGEHVGDWEHVTLRISNFNGELWRVYFAEHSEGTLVEACDLEYQGGNKIVTYSSLHGHAMFSKPGLVLQGEDGNGLRNDMANSDKFFDAGRAYDLIAGPEIVEPPWLNYLRKWGPVVRHDIEKNLDGIAKTLPGLVRKKFKNLMNRIPREVLEEDGPTGPKVKRSWTADEDYY